MKQRFSKVIEHEAKLLHSSKEGQLINDNYVIVKVFKILSSFNFIFHDNGKAGGGWDFPQASKSNHRDHMMNTSLICCKPETELHIMMRYWSCTAIKSIFVVRGLLALILSTIRSLPC